jgi:hypothetical protein
MKLVVGFIVILLVGGALLYYGGGYDSFDPNQMGQDARAKITPGMAWTAVIAAAGEPKENRVLIEDVRGAGSSKATFLKPGAKNPFESGRFEERVKRGDLPHGFIFPYVFSQSVAFNVTFDVAGNVTSVDDQTTMADLLQTKGP